MEFQGVRRCVANMSSEEVCEVSLVVDHVEGVHNQCGGPRNSMMRRLLPILSVTIV